MAKRRHKIMWARQNVEGRQTEFDGSRLVNLYAINPQAAESKDNIILYPTPGLKAFYEHANNAQALGNPSITTLIGIESPIYGNRVVGVFGGSHLFQIKATTDAEYGSFIGSRIGAINPDEIMGLSRQDTQFVFDPLFIAKQGTRMVNDGRRIMWVQGRNVWMWDMAENDGEGGIVTVAAPAADDDSGTLPDEEWVDIAWTDGYFILVSRGKQFFHSRLNSPHFDQSDFSSASAKPDKNVGIMVLNRRLYIFGAHSIENWYNSGGSNFAFTRDNSYTADIGCAARRTIQSIDVAIVFLGTDKMVYYITGSTLGRLSNETVEFDIARSDVEKATAFSYIEEGHRFYSLHLVSADGAIKNWVIDMNTRLWHERTVNTAPIVNAAHQFLGRTLLATQDSSRIWDLRLDWGKVISGQESIGLDREVVAPLIHAENNPIRMHSVEVQIEPDASQLSPSSPDLTHQADVQLSYSDDGTKTFTELESLDVTDNDGLLRWSQLGRSERGRNLRLKISGDSPRFRIISGYHTSSMDKAYG